jgi:hypothetical protein
MIIPNTYKHEAKRSKYRVDYRPFDHPSRRRVKQEGWLFLQIVIPNVSNIKQIVILNIVLLVEDPIIQA